MKILEIVITLLAAACLLTGIAYSKMGSKSRMEFRAIFVGLAGVCMSGLLLLYATAGSRQAKALMAWGIIFLLLSLAYSGYGVLRILKAKKQAAGTEEKQD
ncbi:MAG: hypothetical protein ACREIA_16855 [Opitutaceae bacterium]